MTEAIGKLIKLDTPLDDMRESVLEHLEGAKEKEFECVLVIGVKDGQAFLSHSPMDSTIKVLGMIEALKLNLYEGWG